MTTMSPHPPHFDMDAEIGELPTEGPSFRLGGEEFRTVGCPPGNVLNRLMSAARIDDRGRQVFNAPDVVRFLEECIVEEVAVEVPPEPVEDGEEPGAPRVVIEKVDDLERFQALMDDKKRPIPVDVLGQLTINLANWYGDRPTNTSRR